MSGNGFFQLAFYLVALIGLAKPLGAYMARIYDCLLYTSPSPRD